MINTAHSYKTWQSVNRAFTTKILPVLQTTFRNTDFELFFVRRIWSDNRWVIVCVCNSDSLRDGISLLHSGRQVYVTDATYLKHEIEKLCAAAELPHTLDQLRECGCNVCVWIAPRR